MTDLSRREGDFLLYQTEDGQTRREARFDGETDERLKRAGAKRRTHGTPPPPAAAMSSARNDLQHFGSPRRRGATR